jgi:hypothetical protein
MAAAGLADLGATKRSEGVLLLENLYVASLGKTRIPMEVAVKGERIRSGVSMYDAIIARAENGYKTDAHTNK